jgi:hypothetical protein
MFGFLLLSVYFMIEDTHKGKDLENKQARIDTLESKIEILEDALDARREEVNLLLQLNKDDFDRVNDVEKIERLFEE